MSAPLLVAHRGAPRGGATENTIRAFREAVAAGADGVELDVRGTKDGRVVVFHDAEAVRGGKRVPVRSLTLEELRDPSLEVHDRVPPLEEAIRALLARSGVVVEVKEPGLEEKVASILASLKAESRLPWLLVASFHPAVLRNFARRAPGVRRALVVSKRGPGLLGALRGRFPLRAWRASGATDFMPDIDVFDAAVAARVAAAGGHTFPWTVNDPADAAWAVEAGAAGVITDDLETVRVAVKGTAKGPG